MLVAAFSDPAATRRMVRIARGINPGVHIIARTRYVVEIPELLRLGANDVIPEEFETSIEIFARVRSEEHTSELQSQSNLVCRLLLEKKNNTLTRLTHDPLDHSDVVLAGMLEHALHAR